jgi:hypothetical protein
VEDWVLRILPDDARRDLPGKSGGDPGRGAGVGEERFVFRCGADHHERTRDQCPDGRAAAGSAETIQWASQMTKPSDSPELIV